MPAIKIVRALTRSLTIYRVFTAGLHTGFDDARALLPDTSTTFINMWTFVSSDYIRGNISKESNILPNETFSDRSYHMKETP